MDHSAIDFLSKSGNRKVRKLLGRAYLRENRITEALEVYRGLLAEIPDDPDVLLILGNLYRLAGCARAADLLFSRAVAGNGGHGLAKLLAEDMRQASLPGVDLGVDEASDPLGLPAMTRLGECLLAVNDPEHLEQVRDAAEIVEKLNPEDWSADGNGAAGEEVQTLMPALIELNIRQARAAGYPDLAEALQSLRLSLSHHIEDRWVDDLLNDENSLDVSARD